MPKIHQTHHINICTTCAHKVKISYFYTNEKGNEIAPLLTTFHAKLNPRLLVRAPPVTLLPDARYDEVMTAFGGRGFLVRTPEELRSSLELSLSDWERPSLLNVLIDPSSDRKQQVNNIR